VLEPALAINMRVEFIRCNVTKQEHLHRKYEYIAMQYLRLAASQIHSAKGLLGTPVQFIINTTINQPITWQLLQCRGVVLVETISWTPNWMSEWEVPNLYVFICSAEHYQSMGNEICLIKTFFQSVLPNT